MEYIITTRKGNLTNEHGAQTAETNQHVLSTNMGT